MPARRSPRAARLLGALAAAVAIASVSTAPSLAADPRPAGPPSGLTAQARVEQIRTVDLSRSSAIVRQYTSYWCVPAATQTMINLVRGSSDRSSGTQARLYRELRSANRYTYPTRGNDVRGWARVLTRHLPRGMAYADRSFSSQSAAFNAIVDSMDRTGRPVGIVVDRGTHAWTIVGFRVRETSGLRSSRTILGFYVVGPLGPGRDPWPKAYYTVSQLASRFTRYHESTRRVLWEGKYVIVQPLEVTGAVAVDR